MSEIYYCAMHWYSTHHRVIKYNTMISLLASRGGVPVGLRFLIGDSTGDSSFCSNGFSFSVFLDLLDFSVNFDDSVSMFDLFFPHSFFFSVLFLLDLV